MAGARPALLASGDGAHAIHRERRVRAAAQFMLGMLSEESWTWLKTPGIATAGERTALIQQLIDNDVGRRISHCERHRMQLQVWSLALREWPAPPRETMQAFKARMRNMWVNVVNANCLHFWARIFLDLHADPVRVLTDDCLALAMGSHARLGAGSLAADLGQDILRIVGDDLRVRADADAQAVFQAKYALWKFYIKTNKNDLANVLFYFRLNASNTAQYVRACQVFLADVQDTDPIWRFLLQD